MLKFLAPDKNITSLEFRASLERKSRFLNALIYGWIFLHLLALFVMLIPPLPTWDQFLIIGISLIFSFGIFCLNWRGVVQLAAILFCLITNIVLNAAFIFNLVDQNDATVTAMLGALLSLGILFAGMLVGSKAIFWFTLLNISLVIISSVIGQITYQKLFDNFPIIAFLFLIALISWLYQKTLDQALDNLTEARKEVTRTRVLQRDIEIARDLQQQLYPLPPDYGQRVSFAVRCEPAQETGGDFYDFIDLGGGRLGIIVADVSGKSISAAMVMTMARSMLRQEAQHSRSPGTVLTLTNQAALKDANVNHIFTVFYGILNTRTLSLRYTNAGHPYPMLKRNGQLESLEVPGFPLNIAQDATYYDHKIILQPGDQLIWISDGIVEAKNSQQELFQFERLEATVQQANDMSAVDMVDHIWNAVAAHRGEAEQSDDITLVVANFGVGDAEPDNENMKRETAGPD